MILWESKKKQNPPYFESESVGHSMVSDSLQPHGLSGSSVHGILQARILEWAANSFSMRSSGPWDWTLVSCISGGFFTIWVTRPYLFILATDSESIEFPQLDHQGNPKVSYFNTIFGINNFLSNKACIFIFH